MFRMKRILPYPTICALCRFPARVLSSLFIGGGRGWVDACARCDETHGGPRQHDPAARHD
jgi:hypothetical protein